MSTFLNPRTRLILSLLIAGIGLCLFFSGVYRNFEPSMGFIGTIVFAAAVWSSVAAIHTTPASEAEQRIAPGEWKAWVDIGFLTAILAAMALALTVPHANVPLGEDPDANRFGRQAQAVGIAVVAIGSGVCWWRCCAHRVVRPRARVTGNRFGIITHETPARTLPGGTARLVVGRCR